MAKKRFIVMLGDDKQDGDKQFMEWMNSLGVGSWHWLGHSWLIVDSSGKLTVKDIHEKAREYYKSRMMVVELPEGGTWIGHGPNNEKSNMFTWIHKHW